MEFLFNVVVNSLFFYCLGVFFQLITFRAEGRRGSPVKHCLTWPAMLFRFLAGVK